ncbi:hypothetical protein W02_32360 [Nitrospira sp. KM1]|uniref:hypothetical protein n=1 Tax=Nitrospira sp. KM1 TaxID=1936990 RepID=UPI0013A73436|nr:hypothetical protein [Nitrospira sp. KM1]BCA56096.1 hypothetical protein W02_32360 [Nitrospira sp. KM1]
MAEMIPDEIKHFLIAHIDSIVQLEALLFLREHTDQLWSTDALADQLYADREGTKPLLARLAARGLLRTQDHDPIMFAYDPKTEQLRHMVTLVAETYRKYLIPVTNFVHQKPRRAIQDFADAFRIKRQD